MLSLRVEQKFGIFLHKISSFPIFSITLINNQEWQLKLPDNSIKKALLQFHSCNAFLGKLPSFKVIYIYELLKCYTYQLVEFSS